MQKYRSMRLAAIILFSFLLAVPTTHAAVELMLRGPDAAVRAGEAANIKIVVLNTGRDAATYVVPKTLPAEVLTATRILPVKLIVAPSAAGKKLRVLPNQFLSLSARMMVPASVTPGPLQICLPSARGSTASVTALAPAVTEPKPASAPPNGPARSGAPASTKVSKEDPPLFIDNFMAYEPIYFIYSPTRGDAKFQVSFKYRFFNTDGSAARSFPLLSGIHFAYTQTSLWDLDRESKPFRDTRFMPEVFYLWEPDSSGVLPDIMGFKLQTGFMHESNGKGGAQSRSLNIAYVEPKILVALGRDYEFSLAARGWAYVGTLSENPDIEDFRGYSSVRVGLGHKDGLFFTADARGNPDTGKGAVQLDASYPLRRITLGNFDLFLWGQVFHGYGESLIGFNQKATSVRFGVGITR